MILALLLGGAHAVKEWKTLSEEENLEKEAQLKVINKPPIKSFQMRPKRIQNEMMRGKASLKTKPPRFLPKNIRCPPGSVLVKRTTKEDLIISKEKKALRLNHPTKSQLQRLVVPAANAEGKNSVNVAIEYPNKKFGAKATMNVWNPSVSNSQYSEASVRIENDSSPEKSEAITAGWMVDPNLFKSNEPRLFSYWDAIPNKGCTNYDCPGFVQVSREISLGIVLQSSIYNGTQQEIEIGIFKVHSPSNEPFPAMGSGHFPDDGIDGKSAYFKKMQMWDSVNLVYPEDKSLVMGTDKPECYHYLKLYEGVAPFLPLFFYGGPSQCKH
ncbi:hypothetical protein PTKIN_Ptkin07bG0243200 [Pterospermum kingtungense]